MPEEIKVAEAPVPEKAKAPDAESLIDNRRMEVEKVVTLANETVPEPEPPDNAQPVKEEEKKENKAPEKVEDPLERIKKSVQKRIDKVVAQKKSAEEELAEARSEIERLKASPKSLEVSPKDDMPPTPEQVEAYILKMREEGNAKEEIAATRYLIKLEKELAIKSVRDEQEKAQKEATSEKARQLSDWTQLSNDYVVYDEKSQPDLKSDLTLSNQSGLLYKTALALYNDKELHADFYNDPNVIQGFRRAVSDAYREIHQQNLIKTPKGEPIVEPKRNPKLSLAEPEAEVVEETSVPNPNSLSDAEKVREEIKSRKKNRFIRPLPQY